MTILYLLFWFRPTMESCFEIGLRSHPSTPTYFPPLFSFVVESGLRSQFLNLNKPSSGRGQSCNRDDFAEQTHINIKHP